MPQPKPKVNNIRYGEYYDLQKTFDRLYKQSQAGNNFCGLMNIISSSENIMLAVRTIRSNAGSRTPGTDGRTMKDLLKMDRDKFVALIQKQFGNYKPHSVRRVEIPKPNGKTRPLGIPTIVDRVVQQCVKQVLEPICEAKFYYHSYGFRPDRSAENAIARSMQLMQNANMHYVVDIDIQGFFDNVWHGKLIRQLWNLGIRDKKLLSIIRAMLKAPVKLPNEQIETPQKGTPQGGILSPLLANIVLNELDQWISSQWENFQMRKPYKPYYRENGVKDNSSQYKRLRETSRLKNMFIVRYADDFKIFCRNAKDANKIYHAVKKWLKERLHLEINSEKSQVVNLHNRYSEFLGLKLKVQKKRRTKWTAVSHVSDKAKVTAIKSVKAAFKKMLNTEGEMRQYQAISRYNALIIGLHNYYQMATMVSEDFNDIEWETGRQVKSQLRKQGAVKILDGKGKDGKIRDVIEKRYGKSKRMWYLRGHAIAPVGYVRTRNALSRDRTINRYSEEGRQKRHANLESDMRIMLWLMRNPARGSSVEYADNRLALYAAQKGKCAVTGVKLKIGDIHCHHIKPLSKGGTDSYDNLILITEAAHKLIHATKPETIRKYMEAINPTAKQTQVINDLRQKLI